MAKKVKYKVVTKNPDFENFVVGLDLLMKCKDTNDLINFVYEEDGQTVSKLVDVKDVACKLQWKPIPSKKVDPETGKTGKMGFAYVLPADVIYNYHGVTGAAEATEEEKSEWDCLSSIAKVTHKRK